MYMCVCVLARVCILVQRARARGILHILPENILPPRAADCSPPAACGAEGYCPEPGSPIAVWIQAARHAVPGTGPAPRSPGAGG